MWRLLLWRRAKGWRARGWVTGLAVGLLAHPGTWFLTIGFLGDHAQLMLPNGERVVAALFAGLAYSFASLLALGWLTVPVSILAGALLGVVDTD